MSTNVCSEAFSGHFGLFAEPQEDPVKRSSKTLAEGTQRVHADWTTTTNPGNSRLAEALAGRDRAHAALFACVFTTRTGEIGVDGSDSFETSSKNLNGTSADVSTDIVIE